MVRRARVVCSLPIKVINKMRQSYIVCYDIRDEKRLRNVAKIIEGYGRRIQYSIFYCRINSCSLEKMRWELGKILEKEDGLMIVPLCETCAKRLSAFNPKTQWGNEDDSFIVL